ncbi:MAG: hypothetical protein PHC68_16670 [Syntrophorhabdaceae bacterium]|nr:hypothetical protein [Syntrophorhabdaceae bacterium]
MAEETRKLSLGIKDRLTIPTFFPERSNFVDQILKEDIAAKIRITQEDVAEIELRITEPDKDGRQFMSWTKEKEIEKEVEFTQAEINYLKKQVDHLDKTENLADDMMAVAKSIRKL